jgi:hypothetical protein
MVDYEWADLVDRPDKIRLLISPESEYAINGASAMNRAYDDELLLAFDADAKAGEDGSTAVTFASEAVRDNDDSAAAVTTAVVLAYKLAFDKSEIPADGRVAIVPPAFITQLLGSTTAPLASSADYNTIKALVNGDIDTWVGFKWLTTNRTAYLDANDKYGYFAQRNSMGIAIGEEMVTKISERNDKSHSIQVFLSRTHGATRIQAGVARTRINANI